MADKDRPMRNPIEREGAEHRAIDPIIVLPLPEHRMVEIHPQAPLPILVQPELGALVAAVLEKLDILAGPNRCAVDHETLDLERELGKLVVPAEWNSIKVCTHHHRPRADLDGGRGCRPIDPQRRQLPGPPFVIVRQLLKEVLQGFLVHELVFDRHLEDASLVRKRITIGTVRDRIDRIQQLLPHPIAILEDLCDRWPFGR